MIRLALDTDVMVAAFQSDSGASRQLLIDALDGRYSLLLSAPLLIEYEAVLSRPRHLTVAKLSQRDVMDVLDELAGLCVPVAFDFRWRPSGADGDDELVVETAINGQADAIATFNIRHMRKACESFGIAVERPAHCLRRIRS
ncbi:putative toxin-antitoxin system toxin component, PIN family [Ottowia sp.]|uniref:PIN domain-containing protein n=1 Tax=Ottowia sp. TaxID=1898956 RepID=UPI0039E3D382